MQLLKDEYIIIPMLNMCNKLVLTGSRSLNLLNIMNRPVGDIDFCLTEPLTVDELAVIRDFFGLISTYEERLKYETNDIDNVFEKSYTLEDELKNKIIQFKFNKAKPDEDVDWVKIDIFNKMYYDDKVWVYKYQDSHIRILNPGLTISAKAEYGFNINLDSSTQQKHIGDLKYIMDNYQRYVHDLVINKNIINRSNNYHKFLNHGKFETRPDDGGW